jgi:hydroxyacylglutathione hydrolase
VAHDHHLPAKTQHKQSEFHIPIMTAVIPLPAFSDNYIWLIHDGDNAGDENIPAAEMAPVNATHCAVVDPGDASPVLQALETWNLTLTAILITHHHPDHTGGIRRLLQHRDVPVYGPAGENIPAINNPLREGDQVALPHGLGTFTVIDVPGHTAGHIAYYGNPYLFCGDTLFSAGCGRLFEGTPEQMFRSLNKLAALPTTTIVFPTHEYTLANLRFAAKIEPDNQAVSVHLKEVTRMRKQGIPSLPTTLEREKHINPFLRCDLPALQAAASEQNQNPVKSAVETFTVIRHLKDIS